MKKLLIVGTIFFTMLLGCCIVPTSNDDKEKFIKDRERLQEDRPITVPLLKFKK